MFSQGLPAFSINFQTNGKLLVRDREAWLQIHKLWFLAFGLLSRLDHREDKGQAVILSNGSRLDHQMDEEHSALFGSLGVLHHYSPGAPGDFDKVFLTPYNSQLRGNLKPDAIPLSTLFWLSVACLPLDRRRVYDLSLITQRFHSGGPQTNEHSEPDKVLRFRPLSDVVTSSRYSMWAHAMGCDMHHVHMMEEIPFQSLNRMEKDDITATVRECSKLEGNLD
jgi:hypothetical protein